jgi:hypothetical protein
MVCRLFEKDPETVFAEISSDARGDRFSQETQHDAQRNLETVDRFLGGLRAERSEAAKNFHKTPNLAGRRGLAGFKITLNAQSGEEGQHHLRLPAAGRSRGQWYWASEWRCSNKPPTIRRTVCAHQQQSGWLHDDRERRRASHRRALP